MSMSAAQARTTLKEVMQYAEEGIHYDDDGELELLTERVPSYFEVRVNIRASIAANGEESLRARMLLARFTEARDLRVDDSADTGAYSLRKVAGWMCTEGMSAEGDVDMTKQQQGGTYTGADFKKMLMTQTRKWGMLVEDSNDELKSGAAEIMLLSRLKDIPQAPPQDFQDLPVIIANGVEYVLLDQLVDCMQKSPQDRNVIHEALHDLTEQALAGKDLVNYKMRIVKENVICGTPLWDGMFMEALDRLTIATSDVDRKREEVEEEDVFNEWTMIEQQWRRGFEDSSLPIDFDYDIEETTVTNNEKDAKPPTYEVEVSGSDVSSDEEGEEYDAYWKIKVGGGQASKGWAHAILRLTRVFRNPHLLLRVVLKEAIPDGALQYAALTTIMRSCSNGKRWSRDNRSTGMAAEAGKRPKRVDEEHLFPFTWKSRRHAISITKRDVLRLGVKQWLNDNVIDMYLQSVYDEHFPDGDNMTLHVCTSFWHLAVIANQKVYVAKAGWQRRIKSISSKLRRISNEL
ncbi:hypothetical protein CBR_g32212 [Chara braunii]|uniref:Uncharacterized protein n=1 Tax=Chara braunii TaxID=69332 RepID=A0A388JN12_CHABU|nr:hypothetical protein CBR_g32212 [Chara braunii]|eukprot:GBG59196.1 hypothetical protein CBR_g32212 [Chara braunii]